MSDLASENTLQKRHYVSLVLRLTLDQGGRLIQGELVDMTNTPQKRFTTLSGLNEAVAAWLQQQEQSDLHSPIQTRQEVVEKDEND